MQVDTSQKKKLKWPTNLQKKKIVFTSHQGNTTQNHSGLPCHPNENDYHQKDKNNKRSKGTLIHSWWKCKSVQPLWRTVKPGLPCDPPSPLLGIYPRVMKLANQGDICLLTYGVALFAEIWNQPRCSSVHEWVKKCCIYTTEY
jgi:hypothetical protein